MKKAETILCGDGERLSRQVFRIAWPAALEALLIGMVDLVDMAMVSSLKLTAVSAVGVTSQPKRILLMFTLALNVAATALVSRRIGAGEKKKANHCMHQFLWVSILMALVLYALGFLFAAPLMKLSGANSETLKDAVDYFRILVIGQIPQAVSLTINACLRAEGKTRVTLLTNTAANVVNLIFNYFLIQGNCGFPRLAVKGAAIATSMGSFAAFLISLCSIRRGNGGILHLDWKQEPRRLDVPLLKGAWNVAFSAFHEQFFQRLGIFAFARIAASLGTVEFAIYQFIMNLANLQGYTYDGFASAATALTGQSLGMKAPERAQQAGKYAVWMGYGTALAIGLAPDSFHFRRGRRLCDSARRRTAAVCGGQLPPLRRKHGLRRDSPGRRGYQSGCPGYPLGGGHSAAHCRVAVLLPHETLSVRHLGILYTGPYPALDLPVSPLASGYLETNQAIIF